MKRRYTAPGYDERCTYTVVLSDGSGCVCMRPRLPDSELCWQHSRMNSQGKLTMKEETVLVYLTATIANEYATRVPDFLAGYPDVGKGVNAVPVSLAKAMLDDARWYTDPASFTVGEDITLGTFSAYRALRRRLETIPAVKEA